MNDIALFSLHSSKNKLEEWLLRDSLDFAKLDGREGTLWSLRWHFFLGTLPLLTGSEAQVAACRSFCASWVQRWEEAGRRLEQTLRGPSQRASKTVKFDESSSSSSSSSSTQESAADASTTKTAPLTQTSSASPLSLSTVATENPLVPAVESSYALQFQADAVRQSVAKDMTRLCWDLPLFRDAGAKDVVSDILLKYCLTEGKEYKQGFHELVGFLYYACHRDKICGERLLREHPSLRPSPFCIIFKDVYANIPAAVYALFRRLITEENGGLGLARWYYVENMKEQSGVVVSCERVQQDLLAQVAPELQHLLDSVYDIQSVVYLVRWLRLLFLRELPFTQVLPVWTVLFCERYVATTQMSQQLYVLDDSVVLYFAAQLLLHIRTALSTDVSTAMQLLMKYPPIDAVEDLLYRAIMSNRASCIAKLATAPRVVSAADVVALPAEVTARQGEILARVVRNLEQYWFRNEDAGPVEQQIITETYIQSIAQLKKVRDVLLYGMGE